jgi:NNP family nitrate/nitrite transporter-like MFS transporter
MGVLTDRYGGRIVFALLILISAVPMYLVSYADTYFEFILGGLGFGLSGASFAVGIAYTSVWFRKEHQGTALGIFAMGNAGAALTAMAAPMLLDVLTDDGADLEGWRMLPRLYAVALVITAVVFYLLTESRKVKQEQGRTLVQRLAPLKHVRVWRFGLYYFFLFGGFVALSQWLIPYYVNMYSLSVASAGLMATVFALPAGLTRALGGWMSDKWGPRAILYAVFGASIVILILLFPPRMEIQAPGEGVVAQRPGTVTAVSEREIIVGDDRYQLQSSAQPGEDQIGVRLGPPDGEEKGILIFPSTSFRQEPVVQAGDTVEIGQLLARGTTRIFFQANVWIFTGLVFLLGVTLGIGSAAVFKHIPSYFPADVGTVGGIVGVLGGLGGFISPIIFSYLLQATGIWTTSWMFLALVGTACLVWMHLVVQRMMRARVPVLMRQIEEDSDTYLEGGGQPGSPGGPQ